jgi:hypothetical protein
MTVSWSEVVKGVFTTICRIDRWIYKEDANNNADSYEIYILCMFRHGLVNKRILYICVSQNAQNNTLFNIMLEMSQGTERNMYLLDR